ncbi:uncharacterized protein LOC141587984 [Silene latifolia]|uniref:uncharacterized protein LOC141587984 n=1 Tax=Silene latifolia TaxID=37657 RepID=UPI003D77D20B
MKGVEKALETEFPRHTMRICAQHLYSNFKEKYGGPVYHNLFWRAANTTSVHIFNKAMEEIRKKSRQAAEYLLGVPQQWSKHHFEREVVCDHNTSNFVESFNALINELREKPVLQLMEGIRTDFMQKHSERREVAEKLGRHDLTPYAQSILDSNASDIRFCVVINAGHGELEVSEGTQPFPVDLTKHTCLCGYWQVTGIPCKYACRAIYYLKGDPKRYVHAFYSADNYRNTYLDYIHPMPNEDA